MIWRLSGDGGGVDGGSGEESENDQAIVVGNQPVQISLPNAIWKEVILQTCFNNFNNNNEKI